MGEYLQHWWNGELSQYYTFFGYTVPQLNKICKLMQYVSGFLLIFELVRFQTAMGLLGKFTTVIYYIWNAGFIAFDFLRLIPRFLFGLFLVLIGNVTFHNMINRVINQTNEEILHRAKSEVLVVALDWLQKHPVPDRIIKLSSFIIFAIFSLAEVFTS